LPKYIVGLVSVVAKTLPEENNRPKGKSSPNRQKFAQSGHPVWEQKSLLRFLNTFFN
jgi:hypothetical protein